MNLILADNSSTAYQTGYVFGVILGVCLLLGVAGFAVFAVVMAFIRKTTAWIVTASIACVVVGIPLVFLGVMFTKGFIMGVQKAKAVAHAPAQTITGQRAPYTLNLPPGWQTQRAVNDFDLLASASETYIGVIAEAVSLGTPKAVTDFAQNKLKEVSTDLTMSEPAPATLDGRTWLQFTAKCRVRGVPLSYHYYLYSGSEGTFQIIAWATQSQYDRRASVIEDTAKTFQFPK